MSETTGNIDASATIEEARALSKSGKTREAYKLLSDAIEELADSTSKDLTELLIIRCFVAFDFQRRARSKKAHWQQAMLADYQRAVDILEAHHPHNDHLASNLTNLGAVYFRFNQMEESLRVRQKALAIAETFDDPNGTERLVFWNHVAGTLIQLERLDEAEAILQRAVGIIKADEPDLAYLLDTFADLREAQAKALRARAKALEPQDGCRVG